ncbi:MAG: phosphoglucosamine mutase, partial [Bacteroidetes bacterium]|nr:phosphoglucosamine mutase [Bacteroidota bacterium]
MTLIKSISGIRGTIGGLSGTALTPPDIISFASAYGAWVMEQAAPQNGKRYRLIVGRDARISGMVVDALVCNTLLCLGIDVINAGLATTPTVEMAVTMEDAD